MKRFIILWPLLHALTGCGAIKTKQHALFCVGACIHTEGEAEKKGAEPREKPGPIKPESVTPQASQPSAAG